MKLRQLQCLCAVVDAGFNISRAAGNLHATQPAISKQLRQFEEELGVDLLLRQTGRPISLTQAGERTLLWARRALQPSDNIRGIAREDRMGGEGSIALATSHAHAGLGIGVIPGFAYSAARDHGLRVRDVSQLFEPSISVVLLRRQSHLQNYILQFLAELDAALERRRLEALVFEDGPP